MSFGSPIWLLGLLGIPVLAWLAGRKPGESAFLYSSVGLVKGITQLARSTAGRFLATMRWVALALFFVGMARPQVGLGTAPIKASGIDIVVAFDLSGSMAAEDFELKGKRVNRVQIAKEVLGRFIDSRVNDRIGLVAFARQAYIAAPLTLDHDFLRGNLDRIDLGQVEDGTAIGSALTAAVNRLRHLTRSKSRIVILMTDGQDNASKVPPLTAAEAAQAVGVKVYTIGVGTHGTAPVPTQDVFGRKVYVQQRVDIDEDTLRKIADRTGGRYYRADSSQTLKAIYEEIDKLEKTEVEMKKFRYFDELFHWFVIPGAILIALEIALANTVWRKLP